MFIKKLKSLFGKDNREISDNGLLDSKNWVSVDFWTAGIGYDSRLDNLLNRKIKEKIFLVREPGNPTDKNAIHVKTADEKSLGYVGKNRSVNLAPLIDNNEVGIEGYITSIQADLGNTTYGVKVSLPVSEQAGKILKRTTLRAIDYVLELSSSQNLYMLLNCNKNTFDEVKELLEANEVSVLRAGVSFTPSTTTGKQYRWYIQLANDCDTKFIGKTLRENFPVLKEKYDNRFKTDYLKLQEEELHVLGAQKSEFSETINEQAESINEQAERINELEKELQSYAKQEQKLSSQFEDILKVFLIDVIFVRNSTNVLIAEVEDYTVALKEILKINSDPLFKGTKIHTLNKWYEIHFSTGQRDNGRIYFKKEKGEMSVLVSFKTLQKKDINFLKGYD